jgi:ADP-ribose pyrophosphatase
MSKKIPAFGQNDFELMDVKNLYKGFFKMELYKLRHKLFRGGWSEPMDREILERGHASVIMLYDPQMDSLVMVEQFRVGAIATSKSPWQLEMVAGMIDKDESPEEVARRETFEEAGIEVKRCEKLYSYLPSSGGMTERIHLFVGEVDSTKASGVHGLDTEHEDIQVHVLTRKEAQEFVSEGVIENAASLIALLWLQSNYAQLQERWK